jgi:hypothetical protein
LAGRADRTGSDSTHPTAGIANKPRANHAAAAMLDGSRVRAHREGKTLVIMLATETRAGVPVLTPADLPAVAREYAPGK